MGESFTVLASLTDREKLSKIVYSFEGHSMNKQRVVFLDNVSSKLKSET